MENFKNILYCEKCKIHYFVNEENELINCLKCNQKLISTNISSEDYFNLPRKKKCTKCKRKYPKFLIRCPNCDWQLEKIGDGKRYTTSAPEPNKVKCPYCQSEDVKKITTVGRAVSVGLLGVASGKIGKQWHCNNCKSDF